MQELLYQGFAVVVFVVALFFVLFYPIEEPNVNKTKKILLFHTAHFLPKFVGCPYGVMVKAMERGIVVSEVLLQPRYYVPFRANTLGKSMDLLILKAMG